MFQGVQGIHSYHRFNTVCCQFSLNLFIQWVYNKEAFTLYLFSRFVAWNENLSNLYVQVGSVYVWDVHSGTTLMTYRGDTPVTNVGVSILSGEYVVAALQDKPFLRVWPVNSQQPLNTLRLVCPGKVSHAQVSPDSCYIALTVAEKLHLYQVSCI